MMAEKSADLTALIAGIRSHPGKEEEYINARLRDIRREVQSGTRSEKSEGILKLWYLRMLGYDVSWSAFAIVEVMSTNTFCLKRPGFFACSACFNDETPVALLTINLFKKALLQSDMQTTCLALSCLSSMATPDIARDIHSDVYTLLVSTKPQIRRKSVVCLFRLFLKYPPGLLSCYPRIKDLLTDSDSGVVAASVSTLLELALRNAKNYVRLAPILYKLLCSPHSNWEALKVVKLLRLLCPLEPRLPPKLLDQLIIILDDSSTARSVEYEVLRLVLHCFPPSVPIVKICIDRIRLNYLQSIDINLKCLGLLLLAEAADVSDGMLQLLSVAFQNNLLSQVLTFVSSPDSLTRTAALSVVGRCVNINNFPVICESLLRLSRTTVSQERVEYLSTLLTLGEQNRFSLVDDLQEYTSILVQIAQQALPASCRLQITSQITQLARDLPSLRPFLLRAISILLFTDFSTSYVSNFGKPPPPDAPIHEAPSCETATPSVIMPMSSEEFFNYQEINRPPHSRTTSSVTDGGASFVHSNDSAAVSNVTQEPKRSTLTDVTAQDPNGILNVADPTSIIQPISFGTPEEKAPFFLISPSPSSNHLFASLENDTASQTTQKNQINSVNIIPSANDLDLQFGFNPSFGTSLSIPISMLLQDVLNTVVSTIGQYHSSLFTPFEDSADIASLVSLFDSLADSQFKNNEQFKNALSFNSSQSDYSFAFLITRQLFRLAEIPSLSAELRCKCIISGLEFLETFSVLAPYECERLLIFLDRTIQILSTTMAPSLRILLKLLALLRLRETGMTSTLHHLQHFHARREALAENPSQVSECPDLIVPFFDSVSTFGAPPTKERKKHNILKKNEEALPATPRQSTQHTIHDVALQNYNGKLWNLLVDDGKLAIYYTILGRQPVSAHNDFHLNHASGYLNLIIDLRCESLISSNTDHLSESQIIPITNVMFQPLEAPTATQISQTLVYRSKKVRTIISISRDGLLSGNVNEVLCRVIYNVNGSQEQLNVCLTIPVYYVFQPLKLDEDSTAAMIRSQQNGIAAKATITRRCEFLQNDNLNQTPMLYDITQASMRVIRVIHIGATLANFHPVLRPTDKSARITALLVAREWSMDSETLEGLNSLSIGTGSEWDNSTTFIPDSTGVTIVLGFVSCTLHPNLEDSIENIIDIAVTIRTSSANLSERCASDLADLIVNIFKGRVGDI